MGKTRSEIIKETVAELLHKLDFKASVEVAEQPGVQDAFLCMARVEQDQNFLIGQYGANLAAVQHLVRVMLRKKITERVNVIVDVNEYFLEKKGALEAEAEKAAAEALASDISVSLRPMLPYERKVVHSFLAENPGISTESVGKGEGRKVMVSPKTSKNKPSDLV
ncbi:MAG: R3H domain-containing nucleic acid-binding protein [Candidatus Moraniibacteriota bacterium]